MSHTSRAASLLNPGVLTADGFKAIVEQRGWLLADVALRWKISREYLSRIIHMRARPAKWDDMVRALPRITRAERKAVSLERKTTRPRKREKPTTRKKALLPQKPAWHSAEAVIQSAYEPVEIVDANIRTSDFLAIGDELCCQEEIGGFADIGDFVWILKIRLNDPQDGPVQEFFIENDRKEGFWMGLSKLEYYFCETGRTREDVKL